MIQLRARRRKAYDLLLQQGDRSRSAEADYFFNLGYAYLLDRDPGAAMYWLREAVRRNPADGDAHFVLGAALAATGNQPQATRERELARRLSATYEQWEKRPADELLKGLERLKTDVQLPSAEPDDAVATDGQRDQRELARFYLDRGRRLFLEERDTEALAELNHVPVSLRSRGPSARRPDLPSRRPPHEAIDAEDLHLERGLSDAHWLPPKRTSDARPLRPTTKAQACAGARPVVEAGSGDSRKTYRGARQHARNVSIMLRSGCLHRERRLPRNTVERKAARLSVHGRDRCFGRDFSLWCSRGPRGRAERGDLAQSAENSAASMEVAPSPSASTTQTAANSTVNSAPGQPPTPVDELTYSIGSRRARRRLKN